MASDLRLSPVDFAFIERVTERVTSSNALPFNIPKGQMPDIIRRAAQYHYEWNPDATEQRWLLLPSGSIQQARQLDFNAPLRLPDYVKAIFQVYTSGAGISLGISSRDFARAVLFQSYSTNYRAFSTGQTGTGQTFRQSYAASHPTVSSNIVSLFEYSNYKSVFNKGIRFHFNENSHIFNVMGQTNGASIVVDAVIKLALEDLYNDIYFEDYVCALIEQQLGRIMMTFNFTLPGGITVNYDQIKENGKETVDKIEEYMKDQQANDMIFYT